MPTSCAGTPRSSASSRIASSTPRPTSSPTSSTVRPSCASSARCCGRPSPPRTCSRRAPPTSSPLCPVRARDTMRRRSTRVGDTFAAVIAAAVLVGTGCSFRSLQGAIALRQAQDAFNHASSLTPEQYKATVSAQDPDIAPPESPRESYQRVVEVIDGGGVVDQLDRGDLKVTALAIDELAKSGLCRAAVAVS